MKKIYKIGTVASLFVFPFFTYAQQGKTLRDLVATFIGYLQVAITLIISLAMVSFVWNVYRYFFMSDVSGEKKKEAGLYVLYSTVGFFVILSVWGFVAILRNTFKLPDYQPAWPFVGTGGAGNGGKQWPTGTSATTPAGNQWTTGNTSGSSAPLPPASNYGDNQIFPGSDNPGEIFPGSGN